MDVNSDALRSLVSRIEAMKPAKVKPENIRGMQKLEHLLTSNDYVAENKIDGCHYFSVASSFFSTDHVEKTGNYPHLYNFFRNLNMPNLILDGEINYPGKTSQFCTRVTGSSSDVAVSFQRANGLIHYTIWDMLRTPKGTWIINEPLRKRRELLEYFYNNFVKGTPMEEYIHLTEWVIDNKVRYRDEILDAGLEGIVLKNLDSIYIMGKKPAWQWVKIKRSDTADLFISGYEPPEMNYTGASFDSWPYWKEVNGVLLPVSKNYYMGWIGSLELSAYVNGQARKICTCSGISESLRDTISKNPQAFLNRVVKISYMQETEDGYPRHPNFEEFHESKTAEECVWEFEEE